MVTRIITYRNATGASPLQLHPRPPAPISRGNPGLYKRIGKNR